MGQFSDAIYRALDMPPQPHPDYLEIGSFRPADSLALVDLAADLRIKQLRQIIGASVLHPLNHRTVQDSLFHTWADFQVRQKQFDSPTRAEELDFGHSLEGFSADRAGYLEYLSIRAPDLYRFLGKRFHARIPVSAFRQHAWILGMTGAGKSELIKVLVHHLAKQPNSTTIILDPERKLGEEIAWSRDYAQSDSLIYIDPALGRNKRLFPTINPLQYPSDDLDEQATYAEVFVDAMREALKGEITERMETLLTSCTRVLLRRSGSTLLDLQRFMDKTRNGDLVEAGQAHADPLIREFFAHSFLQNDWTKTKEPLAAKLQVLLSRPAFASCILGDTSVHMERLIESRKTVVLVLDEAELGTLGAKMWGSFFVALLESTIRRMRSGSRAQNNPAPVYLVADEFQRFVTPRFGEILTRARRLGLHLIAANQYEKQAGLSESLRENMRINTAVKMVGLYTDQGHAQSAAKLVSVDAQELEKLGNGKYAIKAGKKPPVVVQVNSDRLGHSNSMTPVQWQAVAAHQLEEYYRPSMMHTAPQSAPQTPTTPPRAPIPAKTPQSASQSRSEAPQTPTAPPPQPTSPRRVRKPRFGRS